MSNLKIGIVVADVDEYLPFVEDVKIYNPKKYDYYGIFFYFCSEKI